MKGTSLWRFKGTTITKIIYQKNYREFKNFFCLSDARRYGLYGTEVCKHVGQTGRGKKEGCKDREVGKLNMQQQN